MDHRLGIKVAVGVEPDEGIATVAGKVDLPGRRERVGLSVADELERVIVTVQPFVTLASIGLTKRMSLPKTKSVTTSASLAVRPVSAVEYQ